MDSYSLLRHFADSWALIALVAVFLGVVVWAFRPGSRRLHRDIANIPFRHEDRPAAGDDAAQEASK
ncbi:cbb3-type cytochrome c oxidase subunit 3 [Defluviimonas sp. D31]|uniref:cbb3-type cytochrome c oxidase subunit 3 n=1 Tax=Defluviimonas sp. D31 TaxID=3083253 RepID=UPI00296EADE8|nr:cbb3-type cytochrome c oxidase subunit 3 [Defluviimonas sp. D31]MDW4551345.1 cbb3-type cytochrome c oxidase subunit 3 [Defluviimonas sp. D31]